jgi:uncharacterized membrane protein
MKNRDYYTSRIYAFVIGFILGTTVKPWWEALLWCLGIVTVTHIVAAILEKEA